MLLLLLLATADPSRPRRHPGGQLFGSGRPARASYVRVYVLIATGPDGRAGNVHDARHIAAAHAGPLGRRQQTDRRSGRRDLSGRHIAVHIFVTAHAAHHHQLTNVDNLIGTLYFVALAHHHAGMMMIAVVGLSWLPSTARTVRYTVAHRVAEQVRVAARQLIAGVVHRWTTANASRFQLYAVLVEQNGGGGGIF